MNAAIKTKRVIVCYGCGEGEHGIDHLRPGDKFGPWSCARCGTSYRGVITIDGAEIESAMPMICTIDLLVLRPQKEPVFFVVHNKWEDLDGVESVYNEHSCPTNWFDPIGIKIGNDDDPHGLIRYLASVKDDHSKLDEEWFDSFPQTKVLSA